MKYKCQVCRNDVPCLFEYRDGVLPSHCPFSQGAMASWVKITPDPQPEDDIVEAFGANFGKGLDGAVTIARTIQAKIQNNNQLFTGLYEKFGKIQQRSLSNKENLKDLKTEVEADMLLFNLSVEDLQRAVGVVQAENKSLRKLFRNHEERIKDLDYDIERHEGDVVAAHKRCEEIERKVESLGLNQGELIKESIGRDFTAKPQPVEDRERSRTAQAPDKNGKKHDLIPGVSVIKGVSDRVIIFYYIRVGCAWGPAIRPDMYRGEIQEVNLELCTWLFDLPLPGGDK